MGVGGMRLTKLALQGLWIAESTPHLDVRGCFARLFCNEELASTHCASTIAQINLSRTEKVGAIRGMHFQFPPHAEIKLVRCLRGCIFDVAVDLRHGSETFLQWHGETLSADNWRMMVIPEGFAHGFQVLEGVAELLYLHSAAFVPGSEGGVRHDDPIVDIEWPLPVTNVSERDTGFDFISDNFQGIQL